MLMPEGHLFKLSDGTTIVKDSLMRDLPWTVHYKCCDKIPTYHFEQESARRRYARHREEVAHAVKD